MSSGQAMTRKPILNDLSTSFSALEKELSSIEARIVSCNRALKGDAYKDSSVKGSGEASPEPTGMVDNFHFQVEVMKAQISDIGDELNFLEDALHGPKDHPTTNAPIRN